MVHLSPEEKRGRVANLIQLKHLQEASSGCPIEAALLLQRGIGDPRARGHGFAQQYPSSLFLCLRLLWGERILELEKRCLKPENPERAALYFVSGVCIGLVLTLAALVMRISCHTDCRQPPQKKFLQDRESSSNSSDSEDGSSDAASDISIRRHRRFERTLNKNVFTSAEELERAQRLEERERIIREIWMNGQPEVPGTRSLNRYY
ncbi:protein eva-1 homolog A [Phacochoerus africanus]|uniref:protein eva-1 homolog A n=1 Tax=Phacochoerus africanus TaxID=41426 RepID=UPI001FDA7204|nr:protein eva-1 homolog A [Phacochoerus africanus]XP_047637624.1 protein eva-1 homolog A [Phacochoerus africanus]